MATCRKPQTGSVRKSGNRSCPIRRLEPHAGKPVTSKCSQSSVVYVRATTNSKQRHKKSMKKCI